MKLSREQMLARALARDARYDGVFITGVLTTGIYCLPSCPARNPKAENIRFFEDEEGARDAGLRPCKRCRPDLFYRKIDPDENLAHDLAELIRLEPASFADLRALAKKSGVGITKLNELFRSHFHTTPAAYLQKARAYLAFRLLLEGNSADQAAEVSGHGSTSTFHSNLRKWTGLSPREIKRLREGDPFEFTYPPGFRVDLLLRQHSWDGIGPDQQRDGNQIIRALNFGDGPVTLRYSIEKNGVPVQIESEQPLTVAQCLGIHEALISLLGLRGDPSAFEHRLAENNEHQRLIGDRTGLRISGTASFFEGIVWVIVGQAVTLAVAHTMRSRLIQKTALPAPGGLLAHPLPGDVVKLEEGYLTGMGLSRAKAQTLLRIAHLLHDGELDASLLADDPAGKLERTLTNIQGLGPWSVNYLMMRWFGLADCVPVGDSGLSAALQQYYHLEKRPTKKQTMELMEPFAPYRSLATFHLWMTLGDEA